MRFASNKGVIPINIKSNYVSKLGIGNRVQVFVRGTFGGSIVGNKFYNQVGIYSNGNIGDITFPMTFSDNIFNSSTIFANKVALSTISNNIFNMGSSGNSVMIFNFKSVEYSIFLGKTPTSNNADVKKIGIGSEQFVGCVISSDEEVIKIVQPSD